MDPELSGAPSTRIHYILALARALVAAGGSARLPDVYAWIDQNGLRRSQVTPVGMTAEQHYKREVRFARQELRYAGLLVTAGDRWQIVNNVGIRALTPETVQAMMRANRRNRDGASVSQSASISDTADLPRSRQSTASTGPVPSSWTGKVRRVDGPAETYALRFGESDLWKIGFASDVRSRLAAINRHVPIEIIASDWSVIRSEHWPSQLAAYAMEQEVLAILAAERTVFERVQCSAERLDAAWAQASAAILAQQPGKARPVTRASPIGGTGKMHQRVGMRQASVTGTAQSAASDRKGQQHAPIDL